MAEKNTVASLQAEVARLQDEIARLRQREHALSERSFTSKMDALGRLAGGIAHDFNNVLLLIFGYNDFLLSRMHRDGILYRYLTGIKNAGEEAAKLARRLMTLSGKRVFQPVVMNLNGVVKQAEPSLIAILGNNVEYACNLTSDRCLVRIEPAEFESVLLSLAGNAREAMPGGGTFALSTRVREIVEDAGAQPALKLGQYVVLELRDSGVGMDDEVRAHAFEPFYSTKNSVSHTGMGLFSVYAIVRQANGAISCASRPGRGTSFTIYLPLVEAAQHHSAAPVRRAIKSKRVLLVEDDDKVRELLREVLGTQGFEVLEAADGPAALERLAEAGDDIDLLLVDVVMPGIDGFTLSVHVCERVPDVAVIYISGYTDNDQLRESVQTANAQFLQKPFTPVQLIEKVRQLLGTPAS